MIQIDELVIRIPGFSEQQARQLGNDVAGHLAESLEHDPLAGDPVGELNIRIPSNTHDPEAMSRLVAEQIITQLRLATR